MLITWSSSGGFLVFDERKKTFSAVGFGQDKIPFLSTQHSDCNTNTYYTVYAT